MYIIPHVWLELELDASYWHVYPLMYKCTPLGAVSPVSLSKLGFLSWISLRFSPGETCSHTFQFQIQQKRWYHYSWNVTDGNTVFRKENTGMKGKTKKMRKVHDHGPRCPSTLEKPRTNLKVGQWSWPREYSKHSFDQSLSWWLRQYHGPLSDCEKSEWPSVTSWLMIWLVNGIQIRNYDHPRQKCYLLDLKLMKRGSITFNITQQNELGGHRRVTKISRFTLDIAPNREKLIAWNQMEGIFGIGSVSPDQARISQNHMV